MTTELDGQDETQPRQYELREVFTDLCHWLGDGLACRLIGQQAFFATRFRQGKGSVNFYGGRLIFAHQQVERMQTAIGPTDMVRWFSTPHPKLVVPEEGRRPMTPIDYVAATHYKVGTWQGPFNDSRWEQALPHALRSAEPDVDLTPEVEPEKKHRPFKRRKSKRKRG